MKSKNSLSGESAPLTRAAQILDAVARTRAGVSLSDIAREVDLPLSTVHRLIRNLLAIEFLEQSPQRGAYRIGPRVRQLFHLAIDDEEVEARASPILEELANAIEQTAFLTRLRGNNIELALTTMPRQSRRVLIQPGHEFPIHATASGKAMFAFQREAVVQAALRGRRQKYRPTTLVSSEDIAAELERVRKQDFAECDDEFDEGVYAIAAPVHTVNTVVYAVGVVGLKRNVLERCSRRELIAHVKQAAARIAERLGNR